MIKVVVIYFSQIYKSIFQKSIVRLAQKNPRKILKPNKISFLKYYNHHKCFSSLLNCLEQFFNLGYGFLCKSIVHMNFFWNFTEQKG